MARAIVGFADLLLGDSVEEVLNAHLEQSRNRLKMFSMPMGGIKATRSEIHIQIQGDFFI